MPFRINPKKPTNVQIFRGGSWKRYRVFPSPEAAKEGLKEIRNKYEKKESAK